MTNQGLRTCAFGTPNRASDQAHREAVNSIRKHIQLIEEALRRLSAGTRMPSANRSVNRRFCHSSRPKKVQCRSEGIYTQQQGTMNSEPFRHHAVVQWSKQETRTGGARGGKAQVQVPPRGSGGPGRDLSPSIVRSRCQCCLSSQSSLPSPSTYEEPYHGAWDAARLFLNLLASCTRS